MFHQLTSKAFTIFIAFWTIKNKFYANEKRGLPHSFVFLFPFFNFILFFIISFFWNPKTKKREKKLLSCTFVYFPCILFIQWIIQNILTLLFRVFYAHFFMFQTFSTDFFVLQIILLIFFGVCAFWKTQKNGNSFVIICVFEAFDFDVELFLF